MSRQQSVRTSPVVRNIRIPTNGNMMEGELNIPQGATGVVLFAHGSGSSRHSPRNRYVAKVIREAGIGTLLFDLLTREEEIKDSLTGHLRFNIILLAKRLADASRYIKDLRETGHLNIGYFGASTGGGAALVAAAETGSVIKAVVSRGGRPDLAGSVLPYVKAPTLLIVGEYDEPVVEMNRGAYAQLTCAKQLQIIPGATHLFEEPGTLEEVALLATAWFSRYL